MGQIFHPYEPDQCHLFPASPRDWLGKDHLAHFVSETVDQLNLQPFYAKYKGRAHDRGNLAYEPRMMLKVLLYSYCTGLFSSRKIAAGLDELVALRFLGAGNRPGHRTIARFRRDNAGHFSKLFRQVVKIAQGAGLVGLGTIAVDGSKLKANASKHKAMSFARMKAEEARLGREIDRIIELAEGTDAAEDGEFGPDFRGDELPKELRNRESRREAIRRGIKALEEQEAAKDEASGRGKGRKKKLKRPIGTPEDKTQYNFTDPESRIMKTSSGGYEQCYNAQVAVDSKAQIIVAASLSHEAADAKQLVPTLDNAKAATGKNAKRVLADAGYKSEANFIALERRKIDGYVSLGRREDVREKAKKAGPATARMGIKLNTKKGRKLFKSRKHVVEPVFGWVKQVLGFRALSMRGRQLAAGEWDLVCLATNLRRLNTKIDWA